MKAVSSSNCIQNNTHIYSLKIARGITLSKFCLLTQQYLMAAKLSENREFSMIIPGPYRKKAVKITHDEEECNNSFALVGSHILDQEEVEALKGILRLVLEVQKLLSEANRRLRSYTEGYKELDNWFLV